MAIIQEDMYDDAAMEVADGEEKSETKTPSALLPKSITMGKEVEVGDSILVTVTRIYDDELEVEYARRKPDAPPMEMEDMDDMEGMG